MNQFIPPKIGYVLRRFPRLSETFIFNEVMELRRQGTAVQIYSLTDPGESESATMRRLKLRDLGVGVIYLPRRPALKKGWRIKQGRYGDRSLVESAWKDLCGGRLPEHSISILQAALVGVLAQAQGVRHLHAHFATGPAAVAM